MQPIVSIIVPVYNPGRYFSRCLSSVAAQTFRDWECILVDDGSTDGSGPLCDVCAGEDSRFRVIHQKNSGASAARNAGLAAARGEHILMLDADDALSPIALETLLETRRRHPDDLLFFCFTEQEDSLAVPGQTFEERCYRPCDAGQLYDDAPFPTPWGKLFSARLLRESGLLFDTSLSCYEDRPFLLEYLRLFWAAHPQSCCRLLCLPLYYYENGGENSLSKSDRSRLQPAIWQMFDRQLHLFCEEYGVPHTQMHTIVSEYLNTLLYGLWCTPKKERRAVMRQFYQSDAYRSLMDFFARNRHYEARYLPLRFHLTGLALALNRSRLGEKKLWWKAHWLGWYLLGGRWYRV